MSTTNPVARIRAKAPKDLIILLPGEKHKKETYEDRRRLVNQRFDYYPYGIALCQTTAHVAFCIKECVKENVKPRIRSGGHHHEGMSSYNNILLIDLSGLNKIEYVDENKAWIPPGKKLKDVYEELEKKGWIIPGGVCDSVNVGGLTQGVGWGISTRKLGYTCDNIEAAEIVKADGKPIIVSRKSNDSNKDGSSDKTDESCKGLFWAIRGGGGGNFGVVTRFLFRLSPLAGVMTRFVLTYAKQDTRRAMHHWANYQLDLAYDENVTIGGRLSVVAGNQARLTLAGLYYGDLAELQSAIQPLLDPKPEKIEYTIINRPLKPTSNSEPTAILDCPLSATIGYLGDVFNPTAPKSKPIVHLAASDQSTKAPTNTCEGRHPNKVSSAFPKNNDPATITALVDTTVNYIEQSQYHSDLNNYVSLHGIGGKSQLAPAGGTPYPFRDKPFIYKIQAWWNDASDPDRNERYVQWVRDFKKAIAPHTDGAFTNFQDKDLVENPDTPEGRIALLEQYYKEHLSDLQKVKKKYDSDNLFDFGMSIPLP
ncbi:MAG: FAD-binding protein [Bacteroidota bacterium]